MKLALMPNPNQAERDDFRSLGPLLKQLRPDQEARVQQIMESWGFRKWGLPVSDIRRAIKKVMNNFP